MKKPTPTTLASTYTTRVCSSGTGAYLGLTPIKIKRAYLAGYRAAQRDAKQAKPTKPSKGLRWGCRLRKCDDGRYLIVNAKETHFWSATMRIWVEEVGRFRVGGWADQATELANFAKCTTPPPDYKASKRAVKKQQGERK